MREELLMVEMSHIGHPVANNLKTFSMEKIYGRESLSFIKWKIAGSKKKQRTKTTIDNMLCCHYILRYSSPLKCYD
jgi:hypothetical protein